MKTEARSIKLYRGDLPDGLDLGDCIAVDTETMGLNPHRDRLCLVQISAGDGVCHMVQFARGEYDAPNLRAVFVDPSIIKIFHYARFDLMIIRRFLGVACSSVYCTKIASKLTRTYTDQHGLKNLCREVLGIDLNKEQQSSDWGAPTLSSEQLTYAAGDVLFLHKLRERLDIMLAREGRSELAKACFMFVNSRVELDLNGWQETDIFAH